ncbi:MAG: hypothetical protein RBT06_09070 [Smithellaceae bacterium]|nr:hypothetical protein [Smithellaceae bacterium]
MNEKRFPAVTTRHMEKTKSTKITVAKTDFPLEYSPLKYPVENNAEGAQTSPITTRKNNARGSNK